METLPITAECKIASSDALKNIAQLLSSVSRRYFVERHIKNGSLNPIQRAYQTKYEISRRYFSSMRIRIDALVSAYKTNLANRIAETKIKIQSIKKAIKKIKNQNTKHQKQRRLVSLETKLAALQKDKQNKSVRICFGSKKLFHAQFFLKENGYAAHQEWYDDWKEYRDSEFFLVGSHDETAGNLLCQLSPDLATLKLRVPSSTKPSKLEQKYGKYLQMPVNFTYAKEHLQNALKIGQAITYRFKLCDDGQWRVYATTDRIDVKITTNRSLGAIGVDLNIDHLALHETDRFGNPIGKPIRIKCDTRGKRSKQSLAILGEACKEAVELARSKGKPLVIEKLDFAKKKASLREQGVKYRQMLSQFAYMKFYQMINSRAQKHGVEVIEVNAAFTSIIGKANWKDVLGVSVHSGAAISIARRGLRFNENPKSHVTFLLPVRNRRKHVWSYWTDYRKWLRACEKRERSRRALEATSGRESATLSRRWQKRRPQGRGLPGDNLEEIGGRPIASQKSCSSGAGNRKISVGF